MSLNRRTWINLGLSLSLGLTTPLALAQPHAHSPARPSQPAPSLQNDLSRSTWQLQRVTAGRKQAGQIRLPQQQAQRPVLRFVPGATPRQGQLVVTGLCNTLSGGYQIERGERIRVGQFVSTQMACIDDHKMRLEQQVGQQLGKLTGYRVMQGKNKGRGKGTAPAQLELQFADGSRWQLQGTLTHEARYGQAQQLFLEVAPELSPCSHPLQPRAHCLRVREIRYDEAGRKRHAGDWESYYGQIEGFTHEPGMRQILRIKRYTNPKPPADGSSLIDVLDLVVEQESVR